MARSPALISATLWALALWACNGATTAQIGADLGDGKETTGAEGGGAGETTGAEVEAGPEPDAEVSATEAEGEVSPGGEVEVAETTGPDLLPDDAPTGFPSNELLVRITQPGGGTHVGVMNQTITVGGVLFGHADSMSWQSSGGQTGAIAVDAYWQTGPLTLVPGDNQVTVTATAGEGSVSDTIRIVYNPFFLFGGELKARPNAGWVGVPNEIVFTLAPGIGDDYDPETVTLTEVDVDGQPKATIGTMVDDGATGSTGDEIQGDGVFTKRTTVTCSDAHPKWFRVTATVTTGTDPYEAKSALIPIWCAQHFGPAQCLGHQTIIQQAETLSKGGMTGAEVVTTLLEHPDVQAAGLAENGGASVWVRFKNGVLGAVLLNQPGERGTGDPIDPPSGAPPSSPVGGNLKTLASRSAIVLAPFQAEFGVDDDGPQVAAVIQASECPAFTLEQGKVLAGAEASLARFRSLSEYGLVSVSTHGEVLFKGLAEEIKRDEYHWDHLGAQEVIWAGEPVQCQQLLQTSQSCTVSGTNPTGGCPAGTVCLVTKLGTGDGGFGGASSTGVCLDQTQVDLRLGRIAITNKGYAILPSFFDAYRGIGFPRSLVNLGACRTLYNGGFATTLFAHGALAITGFSGYVTSKFAREKVVQLFEGAVGLGALAGAHQGGVDPDNPGSEWRLFGAGNLDLSNADLINPSFEEGDITGWRREGDGRVVTKLGAASPKHGKFVGLLSTGLGFTVETGTLEQDFCIPKDKSEIEVSWRFFSEEFLEFCGSQYQDTFQAVLTGAAGQITVVDVKVDDLCGYGDGSCGTCNEPIGCESECMGTPNCSYDAITGYCSGVYPCDCGKYFVGLQPSDVNFDQGGAYKRIWQTTTKNVKAFAGAGKVNLRLYSSDAGDSIYDTVILVDDVKFK
jgi:hypothetical protein